MDTARPPIAVVGVSALFPGSIDATGFWSDILSGKDLLGEVPPSHWLVEDHFDADRLATDKTYGRRGGFLDEVGLDAMAFGIPPNLVKSTDTAQLLALIVAQRVLDDATSGQFRDLDRSRCSVILGVTSGQELLGAMASRMNRPMWLQGMRRAGIPETEAQAACDQIADLHPEWTESTFPGLLGNVVAGRIANRLDLGGTNCVTDAACASSFSALSMGINELYLGDSDMVIAGGVDTMNDIFMYMCFSKTPALSPSEDIRPFSDQADGTMLGEGLGMFALKRLEDAEADGNEIYCVINAVGTSSDGRSKSVYAPVSTGQARALSQTYQKSGYQPDTVELLEAHGTGTVAGDAAEFGGLQIAFDGSGRADRQWCALGTVKSQIGHTKAAAGAAGLFKVVMALRHKVLPPTAKIDRPNPNLELDSSPFYLNTTSRPWVRRSDHERRGSVSSFGFGGSNFHVALSEYVGKGQLSPRLLTHDAYLVVLVGENSQQVIEQAQTHASAATRQGYLPWLSQTSQRNYRADAKARVAIVATDEVDLAQKLNDATKRIAAQSDRSFSTPTGIHYGVGDREGSIAFLFPGQGSQYLCMGAGIAKHFDQAIAPWDMAADLDWAAGSLHNVVFPMASFDPQGQNEQQLRLTSTDWAQPAIGATSLSMLRMLRELGVQPSMVGGHSFGEITALHAAGVLSEADTLRVARRRGELMASATKQAGSMTAVSLPVTQVREWIAADDIDVVIANHNSPEQVVLSGATAAIEQMEAKLADQNVVAKRLPVSTAFHSPLVSDAGPALTEFLQTLPLKRPSMPVHANETAQPYPEDVDQVRAQLGRQLANPVRFVEMIESMHANGARTFVEVGPSAVLTGLVGRILGDRTHTAIAMDKKNEVGLTAFIRGLGRLVAAGVPIDFAPLWNEYADVPNPHELEQPKLVIPINGANHGKPYPPPDLSELVGPNPARPTTPNMSQANGRTPVANRTVPNRTVPNRTVPNRPVADRPVPNPPVPQPPSTEPRPIAVPPNPTTRPIDAPPATGAPRPGTPSPVADAPVTREPNVQQPIPAAPPVTLPSAPDPIVARGLTPSLLATYQVVQQQTADAHATYLNAMAQAHASFLETAKEGFAALRTLGTGEPARSSISAPTIVAPQPAFDDVPAVPMASTSAAPVAIAPSAPPISTPQPASPPPPVATPDPPAPSTAPAAVPLAASAPNNMPVPTAPPTRPALSHDALMQLLLEVVSDKTGYPSDMLNMEMELEADLGIDSIKRVEILSAMQDAVPELPEVDTSVMAKLVTLGEIVEYINGQLGPPASSDSAGTTPRQVAATQVVTNRPNSDRTVSENQSRLSQDALMQLLLDVVSEKTGYPSDMLNMEMELEADLGIDSIKRVEILSAMQDAVPELPEVDTAVMAKLVTLGEIVEYMNGQLSPANATLGNQSQVTESTSAGAAKLSRDSLMKLLLDVVAEKTGYPSDMLNMDMELEADLGIDSIKRVEILSAMQDAVPELPEVDTSVMAKLVALGEIVEYMDRQLGGTPTSAPAGATSAPAGATSAPAGATSAPAGAASSPTGATSACSTAPELGRYILEAVLAPPSGTPIAGLNDGPIAVTDDGEGIAEALVGLLSGAGVQAETVAAIPESGYSGVIFLGGLREFRDADDAIGVNREAFVVARAFAKANVNGGLFVTVGDNGGTFGCTNVDGARNSDPIRCWSSGLSGLARTVAIEWPTTTVKAIDVQRDGRTTDAIAQSIADELLAGGQELEIGLTNDGNRYTLQSKPVTVEPGAMTLESNDVIVVSGGGRGVTATTMVELAKACQAKFALLGRTELIPEPIEVRSAHDDAALKRLLLDSAVAAGESLSPAELGRRVNQILANREILNTIAEIERAGGQAIYLSVDIANEDAVGQAMAEVRASLGPITGIVHGAGVLADKLIADKTDLQFDRVFTTKVHGLRGLLNATSGDALKLICCFSSVAARTGNTGQSDYAMANEILNKVSVSQSEQRGPTVIVKSLGWGPWAGGMVSPALKAHFESMGVALIPISAGARMLVDEIASPQRTQIELVLGGGVAPNSDSTLAESGPVAEDESAVAQGAGV